MSQDPYKLEGVKRRERRKGFPWIRATIFVLALFAVYVPFSPLPGKIKRGLKEIFGKEESTAGRESAEPVRPPESVPAVPETPSPRPPERWEPDPPFPTGTLVPQAGSDLRKTSKGIDLKVGFHPKEGGVASDERNDRESYLAEYTLRVSMPKAARTLPELAKTNPELGTLLPGLEELLANAVVSPWYERLYANKVARLKANVATLDQLVTRHNFYDCETMLNLRHKVTGRRAFLLQADMDVVSDGSDGDRLPEMPERIVSSTNYQPFTSYRWKKTGNIPNPMIAGWEKRIGNAKRELGEAGTPEDRKTWLRNRIAMLERGIQDMKSGSYLIAEYDPFIVIPTHMVRDRSDPYAPNIGDYAVVIYGKNLYPAIVGDAGPTYKVGEASLRMAKEIDGNATPYRRPVSDLTVTYLVFPRSADDPRRAPDYAYWRKRCGELLEELGGLGEGVTLHDWKDLFPPLPGSES